MNRLVVAVSLTVALAACSKGSSEDPRGLPPPEKVQLPEPAMGQPLGKTNAAKVEARNADPHAGLDFANDPRAGMFAKADDEVDDGGDDPHAGGAQDVDPSKFIKGTIAISEELAARAKPGAIVFLRVIRKSDSQTLALARLDVDEWPAPFSIDSQSAMFTGNGFDGDVLVVARLDGDGEARSRAPGDVEGTSPSKIPAEGVQITLSKVLE